MFKIEIDKSRLLISIWKLYIEVGYYRGETGALFELKIMENVLPCGWNIFYFKIFKCAFAIGLIF